MAFLLGTMKQTYTPQKANVFDQEMPDHKTVPRGKTGTDTIQSKKQDNCRTRSNSYTMGCPPVRGYNPRALASGLTYVQVDKRGITILYHQHQCRPCT